jgi:hypothetical protein
VGPRAGLDPTTINDHSATREVKQTLQKNCMYKIWTTVLLYIVAANPHYSVFKFRHYITNNLCKYVVNIPFVFGRP